MPTESMLPPQSLTPPGRPRLSSMWALAALAAYTVAAALWFVSPAFPMHALRTLQVASDGWITVTLVASSAIGLGQLVLICGLGRQRLRDVGWRVSHLPLAVAIVVLLWLAMNGSTVVAAYSTGMPLQWRPEWSDGGAVPGALIAQLLGTALMEETVFRGYLWPQLTARFASRWSPGRARVAGLLASQLAFALLHVPVLASGGAAPGAIAGTVFVLLLTGLVFALLYAATGNLFFVVGVHALGNAPTLLFAPHGPAPTLVLLGASLLVAGLWWLHRRRIRRGGAALAPLPQPAG